MKLIELFGYPFQVTRSLFYLLKPQMSVFSEVSMLVDFLTRAALHLNCSSQRILLTGLYSCSHFKATVYTSDRAFIILNSDTVNAGAEFLPIAFFKVN